MEQRQVAAQGGVSGINVVEDLRLAGGEQTAVALDIELGAQFLTLIAIENAERKSHAEPDVVIGGGFQVGASVERDLAEIVEGLDLFGKFVGAGDVELFDGRAIVEQGEHLNLGSAQADFGGLQVGLVLHALQLEAVEIDLGNVSGVEALAADFENL